MVVTSADIDCCFDFAVLVGEPDVLLRASAAPEDWDPLDPWLNEGSAGAPLDAVVGDEDPSLEDGYFLVESGNVGDVLLSGFEIADDDLWNPDLDTESRTFLHDWTPLQLDDTKGWWHYALDSLQEDQQGVVSEVLDFGDPVQFYVFATANPQAPPNGSPGPVALLGPLSFDRHVYVSRFDAATQTASLFRDGALLDTVDYTGIDASISAAPGSVVKLGDHSRHYNFAAWDRALTNAEIAYYGSLL